MVQTNCLKEKIVVITGPTAIGKSDLAVEIAKIFNGEVISADSMQIYKGLNIGTGKITVEEMQSVRHHLIDVVMPNEEFSVSDFVEKAKATITDIISRGKLPIIVGGTGFYLNGLLNGYNFSTTAKNDEIRQKWNNVCNEKGKEYVYEKLKEVDPVSATQINVNDSKRVIRALEIYETTGKVRGEVSTEEKNSYDSIMIVLDTDRQLLYERINKRVDKMFNLGLVDEVAQFVDLKNYQSMQAIGYKEIVEYLENKITLDEAKELVKKNSRNYAKRQMTFFRWIKTDNKFFINVAEKNLIIEKITHFINNWYTMSDIIGKNGAK